MTTGMSQLTRLDGHIYYKGRNFKAQMTEFAKEELKKLSCSNQTT